MCNFKNFIPNAYSYPVKKAESSHDRYTTLQLIKDLKKELTVNNSEILAQIFPKRIIKFLQYGADAYLSRLWWNKDYKQIYNIKRRIKFNKSAFIFPIGDIETLKKKLIDVLGESKASRCLKLIKRYNNSEITTLKFIYLLEVELGRISGIIEITNKEFGLILGGTEVFIKNILARIRNPNLKCNYNPNYKFSIFRLLEFKKILIEILGKQAEKCLELIDRYERLNTDLKEYPHQQYNILEPHYFDDIDEIEKSYWYGFLCADGWLRSAPDNRIGVELSIKDEDHLQKLAHVLGFDLNRIKEREQV